MNKISILFAALMILFSVSVAESQNTVVHQNREPKSTEPSKPIELSKATFLEKVFDYEVNSTEWKYKGDKPAIVDFYADWCGPCRITSPVLAQLAKEYAGEIYIYKINVDKEKELAGLFGARSIPMFLFIPMDGNPQKGVGALPKESFLEVIDTFLLKKRE